MLRNIFRDTYVHKYDVEEAQEEARQEARQDVCNALLMIVQARFPSLMKVAKTQIDQIKDVTTLSKVVASVGSARTVKEARQALSTSQQAH